MIGTRAELLVMALLVTGCNGEPRVEGGARPDTEPAREVAALDRTTDSRPSDARSDRAPQAETERAGTLPPDVRETDAPQPAASQPDARESEARQPEAAQPQPVQPELAEPQARDREAGEANAEEAAEAVSSDSILRATSRAYEGLRSFRAGFEQTLRNTLLGRTTRSTGTVYQREPDRFLMDFSDPPDDLIVSDGEWFWMYFPSVDPKQVIRTRRGAQGLDLHSQFIGDPVERFEATYHGTESVRNRPSHVMTLVPREPMGYTRLKVWIDAADHLVRRFELTEANGNLRQFELRALERNPALADDLFAFTPPADAQVVTR